MQKNNLIQSYSNTNKNNMQYQNNAMISNNPKIANYIQNNSLQSKIQIAKMEKLRKAQKIEDLGMNNSELIEYVINPIKIEKLGKSELEDFEKNYKNKMEVYNSLSKYSYEDNGKNKNQPKYTIVPKDIADLWNTRKNLPYKQLLHFLDINDYVKKDYKKNSDLIIHKTNQIDKIADIKKLEKELKSLEKIRVNHQNQLETLYSLDKLNKFLKKFEYENKVKNKIKYDPKNCSELKEIYKNEQKRIGKQNKRIDDMVELLMVQDDLSKEELNAIIAIKEMNEKNIQYKKNNNNDDSDNNSDNNDDSDNDNNDENKNDNLDEEIKKEKEINDKLNSNDKKSNEKKIIIIKKKTMEQNSNSNSNKENIKETSKETIGDAPKELMEKYKYRK